MKLDKKKTATIIISVIAAVLILGAAGYYYYFYIYSRPNFEDELYNNVVTSSMERVNPGDSLKYEVNYKNTGYRLVDKLRITMQIPENTSLRSYTEGGIYDEEKRLLQYTIEAIPRETSGSIELVMEVIEPLDNGTEITLGEVGFDYSIKEENFENSLDSGNVHIVESSPDFSSFSVSSVDINKGVLVLEDEIKYTFIIENTGNMIARGVEVKSQLSTYMILTEFSINQSGKYSNGNVTWNFEELPPGVSKTLSFKARLESSDEIEDGEEIINSIVLIYDGKLIAEEETVDIARLFPDFSESSVAISDTNGGGYLWAGETVSAKVTITNTGQRKADDYILFCPIPGPLTYISGSGTAEGISWSDDISGLTWDLNGLEVGESKEITFMMTVDNEYYYKSGTATTDFHITAGDDEFIIEPASIYIQGHPYLNVVAMGDSLIAKSDWVQRLDGKLEAAYPAADYNTVPSAVSGELSFQGLARFDSTVGPLRPQILVVAYGTNDTGSSLSYFKYSIENIILKAKNIGATVFVNLIGPVSTVGKEEWPIYNRALMEVAAKHGIPVINVTSPLSENKGAYLSDGTHYTSEGSEVVAQTVFNSISQYLNGLGGRR
ncbi:GDSL-type esterase/lipase family protein [Actinomycetota bacterium]